MRIDLVDNSRAEIAEANVAYDEKLSERIEEILSERDDVLAKKMFGGVAFMVKGKMACGIVKDELMVRLGPERYEAALHEPFVREMDFVGKPMRGMVYVAPEGIRTDATLARWVNEGAAYATLCAENEKRSDGKKKTATKSKKAGEKPPSNAKKRLSRAKTSG